MEVSCPNCYTTYPLNPEKLPEKGATPTCKKCGTAFTIVRATGDPVKDRAQRMKGYVLVRDAQGEEFYGERANPDLKGSAKKLSIKDVLGSRQFRRGAWAAGIALALCCAAFFVWKNQVHARFEEALRSSLVQVSNKQFAVSFEKASFSWFGGLTRDRGCIHGLSIINHQTRETLKLADKIFFELEASEKRFITKPFNIHAEGKGAKTVLKGCVLESSEGNGSRFMFKAEEIYSVVGGIELFTVLNMDLAFSFKSRDGKEDPLFISGDGDFHLRAREVHVWSEPIIKGADILLSIKNGVFAKDRTPQAPQMNAMDLLRTRWGENRAVASLERCSLTVFGATVKAAGAFEFQTPAEQSKASLNISVSNFSPIMKYLHRVNETAFDRILVALVALEEKNSGAYNKAADSLEFSLSYKDATIRVNNQHIQTLL